MSPNMKQTATDTVLEPEAAVNVPQQASKTTTSKRSSGRSSRRVFHPPVNPLLKYIPERLRDFVLPYHGDFCLAAVFHPQLVAQLMAEGFLPIATEGLLLPKMHRMRSVIDLPDGLHISKSVRKKSKRYRPTWNQAFDEVIFGCHEQHGRQCWLHEPLVEAFRAIQSGIVAQVMSSDGKEPRPCPVRLYSMELWDIESGDLVAGELGYTVGSIYTSLTGFSRQDSAGSVQLACLGALLRRSGFDLWDLGMDMEYKRTLGAHLMPRDAFVSFVKSVRVRQSPMTLPDDLPSDDPRCCRDWIDGVMPMLSS